MNSNRFLWLLVAIMVLTTAVVTFRSSKVNSQENLPVAPQATPPTVGPDFGRYGKTDYSGEADLRPEERERRRLVSKRYDNEGWVIRNPQDQFGKIGRVTESIPPPIIPTKESDLILVGKITDLTTHLSNDKGGVYSEFKVKISQVLKNNPSAALKPGDFITLDRAGGVVRYPDGQVVLYLDSREGLPEEGHEYALFLRSDMKSDRYEIVTLLELLESKTIPVDSGRNMDEINRMGRRDFITAVQDKLLRPDLDENP